MVNPLLQTPHFYWLLVDSSGEILERNLGFKNHFPLPKFAQDIVAVSDKDKIPKVEDCEGLILKPLEIIIKVVIEGQTFLSVWAIAKSLQVPYMFECIGYPILFEPLREVEKKKELLFQFNHGLMAHIASIMGLTQLLLLESFQDPQDRKRAEEKIKESRKALETKITHLNILLENTTPDS